jgi:hypothetical protein
MSVGQMNDEGVPLDTTVNMRLSKVCGLVARQMVLLTLQGFDELTENEKNELFEYSIEAYIQSEAEGVEDSYEDHLSCLKELQE